MHNLSTVIRFEVRRTLKKKSFWIMTLAFPLMIGLVFAIIFFANITTENAAKDTEKQKFSIAYRDESGRIDTSLATGLGAVTVASQEEGVARIKNGTIDAFFYYPADLSAGGVRVYGRDVGLFDNGRYLAVARTMLEQSTVSQVNPDLHAIVSGSLPYSIEFYKDGEIYDGFKQLIAPGVFLVLFYIVIAVFGNQMLTSTTEEKENRVIEMILTTIEAQTLIIGKIISLVILALIQVFVVMLPTVIAYISFRDKLSLPSLDLSNIPLDPMRISIGFIVFAISFLLFTGLLVMIGAASPTAKEAGGFFGAVMVLIFGPLYAASLFVSAPGSLLVQVLSYFPLTAPIPLLLRNAVGNLELYQAAIAIILLAVATYVIIKIAVRVFRFGALEYSRRLSIREILGRR